MNVGAIAVLSKNRPHGGGLCDADSGMLDAVNYRCRSAGGNVRAGCMLRILAVARDHVAMSVPADEAVVERAFADADEEPSPEPHSSSIEDQRLSRVCMWIRIRIDGIRIFLAQALEPRQAVLVER